MEKIRFKELPVGTYFTRVTDRGTHNYYFKTEEVVTYSNGNDEVWVNAVMIQGSRTGSLEGFPDDTQVYAGII